MSSLALRKSLPLLARVAANPSVRRFAARQIQSAWRGFRARKKVAQTGRYVKRRMGSTPVAIRMLKSARANPSRRVQQPDPVWPSDDPAVERTLYVKEICRIDQGAGIVNRNRDCLYLSGVKICCNVANATDVGCIFFNWAIVRQKSDSYPFAAQWFRSNADERAVAFDEETLTANDYHCRPLSPDDKYIVAHQRYKLAPEATGNWGNLQNTISIDKYIPLKK